MASSTTTNLSDTALNPEYIINPKIIRLAPVVSITEVACILVNTSGILTRPIAPIKRKIEPKITSP